MTDDEELIGSITHQIGALGSKDSAVQEEAARQIWQRYFAQLSALVRKHLDKRIRRREDEEDVVQETYGSFFRRQQRGDFELASRNELWQLLVTIILRKVKNTANRHQAERRDHRREEHVGRNKESLPPDWVLAQIGAAAPTPAEAVALTEEFEGRLQALSEPLQQIALWKLDGCTHEEIAAKLGCSKRTVIRKIDEIRLVWADAADGPIKS